MPAVEQQSTTDETTMSKSNETDFGKYKFMSNVPIKGYFSNLFSNVINIFHFLSL